MSFGEHINNSSSEPSPERKIVDTFFNNNTVVAIALYYSFCESVNEYLAENSSVGSVFAMFSVRHQTYIQKHYGFDTVNRIEREIRKYFQSKLEKNEFFSVTSNDSFGVFMNCDIETAKSRLESYFDEISNMMANDRCHIKTAFACGICALPENVTDINTLQPSVANAMQEAFAMNTVLTEIVEYSDELSEKVRRNEKIKGDLYKAVENHELLVEIQPKYNMETGVVSSAEALVRWVHPELGKIYPDDFIPYAERTGEIIDIDMCVLEEVCRHMRKWMDEGYNVVPVAVNQSRLHIADPNYAASVFRMMQKYDVWPNMIMLETTESIAFSDYNDVTEILRQLHSYGFILSMDDFGSGYSSLNMLNELEYDELKLDMKLVRKCNDDERSKTIIRHIISMAHDLNMKVVAEGVETKEQLEALRDAGCDVAQGFYYAKPMSIENFEASVFGRIAPEE